MALSANWVVVDDESRAALLVRHSEFRIAVATPDYEALVAAKSRALLDLSRDIAAGLRELASP